MLLGDKRTTQTKLTHTIYIYAFLYVSKIAYGIHDCSFVIHTDNCAFPVIVYLDKRINCVTAGKSKIYIRNVALIATNFNP